MAAGQVEAAGWHSGAAEVTGGLEHPGIVPVYGLGQYPDGRPYYAMRFIKGDSLKEAIDAFHAPRPFSPVSGKYGETLVVDWGLATANTDLKTANTDLATANIREHDARTLAETNEKSAREQSRLALTTLTSVITDIQGGLAGVPGSGEVRRRLLKTALGKRQSVSTKFLSQAAVDRSTGQALNAMGDVIVTFGTAEPSSPDSTSETLSAVQLAESYYQRAFQIVRSLVEADPESAVQQRDLAVSHYKVGTVRMARDEFSVAAEAFDTGGKVLQAMIERGMNLEQSKSELAMLQREAQAARMAEVALGDWEALLQITYDELPALLEVRSVQFSKRSRFVDAARAAETLRELDNADNGQLYNAACVFSLCAASIKAAEGSELTTEQITQRQTWINEALASLKLSIDKRFTDFAHMQQDSDLTILRDLPEFRALLPASPPCSHHFCTHHDPRDEP